MSISIGDRLARYEILSPIGAGGMGEVWRARDSQLGREVAVKVLPEELAADPRRSERFRREARALAALSHPNLLEIHEVGSVDGLDSVVTELLERTVPRCLEKRPEARFQSAADLSHSVVTGIARGRAPLGLLQEYSAANPDDSMSTSTSTPSVRIPGCWRSCGRRVDSQQPRGTIGPTCLSSSTPGTGSENRGQLPTAPRSQ